MLRAISAVLSVLMMFYALFTVTADKLNNATFTVDVSQQGTTVDNKVGIVNAWGFGGYNENTAKNTEADLSFVKYIELMTATGGSEERDLFKNPNDRSVLDDYDFSKLISACEGVLNLDAKPYIITGNVPLKFSSNPIIGTFGVNVCPPDDYNVYYNYIHEIFTALVAHFGLQEVQSWYYGVLTEYENSDWFYAGDKDPAALCIAYCKLYDYTVEAMTDVLGDDFYIGAHSMTVAEGLWDERDFIKHCATGTNYANGAKGTKIDFLTASFYDSSPGNFNKKYTLKETIDILRDAAESYGLNDLDYGVDEGRILSGTKGSVAGDLNQRVAGYTWQGAYDARLLKTMMEEDISFFTSWGYTTASMSNGYPTISYHVANCFSKMVGSQSVDVDVKKAYILGAEQSAFASWNEETQTLYMMAYNFKNDLKYKKSCDMTFDISVPQLDGKTVTVTKYEINDNANFFDEWLQDRKTFNITDDCFVWSPEGADLDNTTTLSAAWAREIYETQLRDKYKEYAKLTPTSETLQVKNGKLTMTYKAAANTVVFYEITAVE